MEKSCSALKKFNLLYFNPFHQLWKIVMSWVFLTNIVKYIFKYIFGIIDYLAMKLHKLINIVMDKIFKKHFAESHIQPS